MPGFDKLLRGILKFRREVKPSVRARFQEVRDNPTPKAVMFTCMDSRLTLSMLIQQNVGDIFMARSAGNLIPNHDTFSYQSATVEAGILELACLTNNIRHVVVTGHSDCKAMNALFEIRNDINNHTGSHLHLWLKRHGARTVAKYEELEMAGGVGPIKFKGETAERTFTAYIDKERKWDEVDRFSQVNTLQQLQNIASYTFLHPKLLAGEVKLNALWFDIYTGDFYMFSREQQRYIEVTEDNYEHLAIVGRCALDKEAIAKNKEDLMRLKALQEQMRKGKG